MNPVKRTNTSTFRAGWHLRRDGEVSESVPDASSVAAEHGQVFRLNLANIALISNGKTAALGVGFVVRVEEDGR